MIKKNELHSLIQSWENLAIVANHISEYPEHLDVLINLALDDKEHRNWRAAWMIDRIHEKHPELVLAFLPVITDFVLTTRNSGKKRHLLKIISLHPVPGEKVATMLDFCIEVFSNTKEPIAVRVHAMQILYNITTQEPDFARELTELIEREMEYHGSAGMSSRGRKLLKKLYLMSQ